MKAFRKRPVAAIDSTKESGITDLVPFSLSIKDGLVTWRTRGVLRVHRVFQPVGIDRQASEGFNEATCLQIERK